MKVQTTPESRTSIGVGVAQATVAKRAVAVRAKIFMFGVEETGVFFGNVGNLDCMERLVWYVSMFKCWELDTAKEMGFVEDKWEPL